MEDSQYLSENGEKKTLRPQGVFFGISDAKIHTDSSLER
jgi:hypothetical protein